MTIDEASQNLKEILDECTESEEAVCYVTDVDAPALEMAIQALEEIQQYRAIGTIEKFKTLKKKATQKKVAYQGEHEKCPTCGSFHVFGKHCTECGQAIYWIE